MKTTIRRQRISPLLGINMAIIAIFALVLVGSAGGL